MSDRATEKQAAGWVEAIARLRECGAMVPDGMTSWDLSWSEETRPGRGSFLNAQYIDGEIYAQVLMDVYGYPNVSFADLDWIHADSNEECGCAPCVRDRDAEDQS